MEIEMTNNSKVLTIRISKELHESVKKAANRNEKSVNKYVTGLLTADCRCDANPAPSLEVPAPSSRPKHILRPPGSC